MQGGKEANLCFSPVTRGIFNGEFVRKTIEKCSKLHWNQPLSFDREFYATDVMQTVRSFHRHFIMPAKKDAGIKVPLHSTPKESAAMSPGTPYGQALRSSRSTWF